MYLRLATQDARAGYPGTLRSIELGTVVGFVRLTRVLLLSDSRDSREAAAWLRWNRFCRMERLSNQKKESQV
jgi:hypothetical protein